MDEQGRLSTVIDLNLSPGRFECTKILPYDSYELKTVLVLCEEIS